ncbi:MAG: glycosyltransferase [Flavobacterium sp.]|nr:glycosyltransferase [Flavobacterium sp.]
MMIPLICLLLLGGYFLTIGQLIWGARQIRSFESKDKTPSTFFSIIIPFRDEAQNLPRLLESFKNLNYPHELFELIFVDDFSTDESVKLLYQWRTANGTLQTTLLENIRLSQSPKKDAITRAIPIVQKQWIVTTDADCEVPTTWLSTLDSYLQTHSANMVVGAVHYESTSTFLDQFQLLDLLSLQGATQGSFGMGLGFLCNGANLAYTKSHFQQLQGFTGNDSLASGDDVFLLQKSMAFDASKVQYLKSKCHLVYTKPEQSWKQLLIQRTRWASKTGNYSSVFGKDLAIWVLLGNLSWIVLGTYSLFLNVWIVAFVWATGLKFTMDWLLIREAQKNAAVKRLRYLLCSSLLYPFYCVFVALHVLPGTYTWKGRKLS